MCCPHVRGDNTRALANELSYVQEDKLSYATYISVDIAHHEAFHAKVGKGDIMFIILAKCVRDQSS